MKKELIKIKFNDKSVSVEKQDYISAKTRDLIDFGYNNLSEKEVSEQLEKILSGDKNLTVIGLLMREDIVLYINKK